MDSSVTDSSLGHWGDGGVRPQLYDIRLLLLGQMCRMSKALGVLDCLCMELYTLTSTYVGKHR